MGTLIVGDVYRYARPYSASDPIRDELPNYFHCVRTGGEKLPLLEAGINPIRSVKDPNGRSRLPAILISSSPHKIGSEQTPWQDIFDVDHGLNSVLWRQQSYRALPCHGSRQPSSPRRAPASLVP